MKNLPKINPAKAVKASLPYVLAGLLCTKLGEAYRLTTGGDVVILHKFYFRENIQFPHSIFRYLFFRI